MKNQILKKILFFFFLALLMPTELFAGTGDEIREVLSIIFVLFVVFLILREVNCWYWKINHMIRQMDKMIILLEALVQNKNNNQN